MRNRRLLLLGLLVALAGCFPLHARRTSYAPAAVLVLPGRDVVQDGMSHEQGAGSGMYLSESVAAGLSSRGWKIVRPADPRFDSMRIADKSAAIEEARRLGARYVLQLVLGEFRNAAPMTFRDDFVVLQSGVLWDVETGEAVWEVTQPLRLGKENFGGHVPLIASHADLVVRSLSGR